MHRDFRKLLTHAEGEGDFVVVANLDIRGFSQWSQEVESVQAAMYLAKLYPILIDKWFKSKWFFKPTGDGLLLVRPFKEPELGGLATETLMSCVEIVAEFGSLCRDKPMLNFDLPTEVGIGLAQGAASRLVASGKVLDYSGAILNRASRLMDLARPRGIVFDGGLALGLLPENLLELFDSKEVYLRGVSPHDPLTVYYLRSETEIPEANLSPIGEVSWGPSIRAKYLLRDLESLKVGLTLFRFPKRPSDLTKVKCKVGHEAMDTRGRKHAGGGWTSWGWTGLQALEDAEGPFCRVDLHAVAKVMRDAGVKRTWPVQVQIDYPI